MNSMRHGVVNDVDAEREGVFLREGFEKIMEFPLPLPTIAVIGVVGCDHDHSLFVIEPGPMMDRPRVAVVVRFPGAMFRIVLASLPQSYIRDLTLFRDLKDAVIELV